MLNRYALHLLLIAGSVSSHAAVKDWPPEAQTYLQSLPGQTLTLDAIVGQAISQADIFQAHKSEALRAEAVEMETLAAEDVVLSSSYNYYDSHADPINPLFQTIRSTGWEARAGAETFFSSGTAFSVFGVHGPQTLKYRTNPTVDVQATSLNFGITQSLWRDFFGTGYRAERRSAASAKQSIRDGMMNLIELSAMDVINLYYQAWLKQQVAKNLFEATERQQKLVKILRRQQRQGTLETPDLLQVESLSLSTEAEFLSTKRDLQSTWEQLVISLKLPRPFLKIDASEIPIGLDSPENKSAQLCEKLQFEDLQKNSFALKEIEQASLSAAEKVKAMESKMSPDLSFRGTYVSNGVDRSGRETFRNIESDDYPAYTAGLYLTVPLQNRALKSEYLAAKAAHDQLRYRKAILLNNLETQWGVICQTFDQKRQSRDKYKAASNIDKRRVALENRRFSMGRLQAVQWTQAEEAEAADYLKYQQAEVEVRQVAWEIQRQTGALSDFIRPYLK